jgi:hypothetical protein
MVYLVKSIGEVVTQDTDATRQHADRLHAELAMTPCSPRCAVWLLYGIQPPGCYVPHSAGAVQGSGAPSEHPGATRAAGAVSRKWSGKTLNVPLCSTSTRIAQHRVSAGQSPGGPTVGSTTVTATTSPELGKHWVNPRCADGECPACNTVRYVVNSPHGPMGWCRCTPLGGIQARRYDDAAAAAAYSDWTFGGTE